MTANYSDSNESSIINVLSDIITKKLELSEASDFRDFSGFLEAPINIMKDEVFYHQNLASFISKFDDIVLIGTGGSSLGAQCLVEASSHNSATSFHYANSSSEHSLLELQKKIYLPKTGFVISSKSGNTTEIIALFEYFYSELNDKYSFNIPGEHFIAITESGSVLDLKSIEYGLSTIIHTDPSLVGRYSVFSPFGTCLAYIAGISLDNISRGSMSCLESVAKSKSENQVLELTKFIFDSFESGKDKLVIIYSKSLYTFALWIEQLIAESLGKNSKGIIPVIKEDTYNFEYICEDSTFIILKDNDLEEYELNNEYDYMNFTINNDIDLSFEMMKWQLATVALGSLMNINPFNQPQVEISKSFTREFMDGSYVSNIKEFSSDCIYELFESTNPTDYVCLLNYLNQTPEIINLLNGLSKAISNTLGLHCIVSNAPAYLHSTGQLHKGGTNKGVFIQFFNNKLQSNILVPNKSYTFSKLFNAQADGDLAALVDLGRRVCRVDVGSDPIRKLEKIQTDIKN